VATTASEPHTIVQSWVSVELAQELKAYAQATGCSVSSLVRDALVDQLRQNTGEGPAAPLGGEPVSSRHGDAAPTST
jgi:hypothetical protein